MLQMSHWRCYKVVAIDTTCHCWCCKATDAAANDNHLVLQTRATRPCCNGGRQLCCKGAADARPLLQVGRNRCFTFCCNGGRGRARETRCEGRWGWPGVRARCDEAIQQLQEANRTTGKLIDPAHESAG